MSRCVDEAMVAVEEHAVHTVDHDGHVVPDCKCLPLCTEIEYPHETSFGKVNSADMLDLPEHILATNPQYSNNSYVKENVSVLHIYFKALHFTSRQRKMLYNFVDFLSNIGGLLGLCCGFSLLSLVELGYFVTLKIYYRAFP